MFHGSGTGRLSTWRELRNEQPWLDDHALHAALSHLDGGTEANGTTANDDDVRFLGNGLASGRHIY
ncbi:MAG: hypothetical protein NVSMB42_00020 [Herpetosiphon sp.]